MFFTVRRAKLADAGAIALVHVRGWQEAYAHLVPPENLARLSAPQRERRWREIIPLVEIWVATESDTVIGFAGAGPNREADAPRTRELQSLYILASHYGTGAGQQLLDAALGDAPAFLWVADDNPRARAFYSRNRFEPDGATKIGPLAGTDIREARLVR